MHIIKFVPAQQGCDFGFDSFKAFENSTLSNCRLCPMIWIHCTNNMVFIEHAIFSYEAQVDYYTNYIQLKPEWELVRVYTDEYMPYGL